MTAPRGHPEAIVRPRDAARAFTVDRLAPADDLARYVDYHWFVRWRLEEPFEQQVVPQPRVHVAAEHGRLFVHGVSRERFWRRLEGDGRTLGSAFLAGGFRCFLDSPVAALAGRVVPASEVLGVDDAEAARVILATDDPVEAVAAMEEYLRRVGPSPDSLADQARAVVDLAEQDHEVRRAEDLASRAGLSLRTLQRLFGEYVGAGPRWVIRRFRILEAAEAAHGGEDVDWAALAATLGFSDQSHLVRTFTEVVGTPPATYRREARGESPGDG